jgi:predicted ATPase
MYSLFGATVTNIFCGRYEVATVFADELIAMAAEKDAALWRALGTIHRGRALARSGKAAEAVHIISSGIRASQSTGSGYQLPSYLSGLAWAYALLGQIDDASRCIDNAIATLEKTKERWFEAEASRLAGEIMRILPKADTAKAQAHFDHALVVAHQQQAKSWELRAAMSLARLWRSQGKVHQARELLAPVYGWFTEGFDTRDLKEAKELLKELARLGASL